MVESSQNQQEEEDQDKTFLEQPDILDKIKAAAVITDGMCNTIPLLIVSLSV